MTIILYYVTKVPRGAGFHLYEKRSTMVPNIGTNRIPQIDSNMSAIILWGAPVIRLSILLTFTDSGLGVENKVQRLGDPFCPRFIY